MEISNSSNCESKLSVKRNDAVNFKSQLSKGHLSAETVRKMILRFLSEKHIPKQKLAKILGITEESLLQLCFSEFSTALISKINLPLVKLYCKTKF
ncbi:MAG: hypothetical protein ACD_21C00209G0001 [uncultured bacterium]|nr:MAG: hypothetical protein ACD_21C00209G0001 [uncultured bacterium]